MEIKLSLRMKAVADMASGNVLCDIGCDHGLVSIYLVKNGSFEKAIAMDLREGPLNSARKNISANNLLDKIELRLSNGFDKLDKGEADCAVIAGMGGILMTDILKRGSVHTDSGISLILQPQSDYDMVRSYLLQIDYSIVDEVILLDDGKYYFVIRAGKNTEKKEERLSKAELLYGPKLLAKKDELLKAYLMRELYKKREILASLFTADTERAREKSLSLKEDIAVIEDALAFYGQVYAGERKCFVRI